MTLKEKLSGLASTKAILLRMLTGWIIGFAIISFFIFQVSEDTPDWGPYWRVKPLIITPLAAAFGILSFYLNDLVKPKHSYISVILYFLSTLAFIIALWLGIVLGLNGTLWD